MSLSAGLSIARSALAVAAEQSAIVSRNLAAANDPAATRKNAVSETRYGGGAHVVAVVRAEDVAGLRLVLSTGAAAAGADASRAMLDRLQAVFGDPDQGTSPATLVGKLTTSLVQLSSDPANTVAANAAIGRARELVDGLNAAGEAVSALRRDVDSQIASTVEAVGELLRDFEQLNTEIVRGFRTGRDTTDALDRRDQILGLLSREISIRAVPRADNDIALFTESGVTLFETTARDISFAATPTLAPGVLGGAVVIDGVPLLGMAPPPASFGATTNGRLGHLLATRDRVLPTVEAQLDEIARGLVVSFREVDQSAAPSLPDAPGLFTWPGAPAVPVAGVRVTGLASTIALNSAFDPASGGSAGRLRDGGANGAAYVANSSGAIGFSGWLNKLIDRVQEPQVFSTSAGLATSATIGAFAASSAGWVAEVRQRSIETAEQATVTAQRASDALRATTGINLDAEMLQLIEVERSFQASSKLINAIDEMFESLLSAVR